MKERREPFGGFVVINGTREQYENAKCKGSILFGQINDTSVNE